MTQEYKSVESMERTPEEYFINSLYGVVASAFRLPTSIRKNFGKDTNWAISMGAQLKTKSSSLGTVAGLATLAVGTNVALDEACKGNYTPLIVLGATNIASGIYELGRKSARKTLDKTVEETDSQALR